MMPGAWRRASITGWSTEAVGAISMTAVPVSEAEFQGFLDGTITPAFPDGLTVLKGLG